MTTRSQKTDHPLVVGFCFDLQNVLSLCNLEFEDAPRRSTVLAISTYAVQAIVVRTYVTTQTLQHKKIRTKILIFFGEIIMYFDQMLIMLRC